MHVCVCVFRLPIKPVNCPAPSRARLQAVVSAPELRMRCLGSVKGLLRSETGIHLGKRSAETFLISWAPKPAWGSAHGVQPPGHPGFPALAISISQTLTVKTQSHAARNPQLISLGGAQISAMISILNSYLCPEPVTAQLLL